MKTINTLEDLAEYRERIVELAKRRKAQRIAVFGSIVRGDMHADSDIDFLVDFDADCALPDQLGLIADLGDLLGRRVDVVERDHLREELAPNILAEETPLGAKARRDLPPMKRNQRVYLDDILDRIDRIEEYTSGGYDEFMSSQRLQNAAELCFTRIGESVKRLDEDLIRKGPEAPWQEIVVFGNDLIERYDCVDPNTVWGNIQLHVPALKEAATALLRELDE